MQKCVSIVFLEKIGFDTALHGPSEVHTREYKVLTVMRVSFSVHRQRETIYG